MHRYISVLQASQSVDPGVLHAVFCEGIFLLRSPANEHAFVRHDVGAGRITTERKTVSMGGLVGVACEVVIEGEAGAIHFSCVIDDPGPEVLVLFKKYVVPDEPPAPPAPVQRPIPRPFSLFGQPIRSMSC